MTKSEQSGRVLARLGETRVAVRRHADGQGQDILVQATSLGEQMAHFLAAMNGGGAPEIDELDGQQVYRVPHGPDLDRCLVQLIDLLIDLRWAHPRLVQLELVMSDMGERE